MSWNAYLYIDSRDADEGDGLSYDWNYTHNCNGMIRKVLDVVGVDYESMRYGDFSRLVDGGWQHFTNAPMGNWWDALNGASGADGYKLLDTIVHGLMEAPALFRAMNPENGWGDYDSLLEVLVEMRDRSERYPHGQWSVHG